MDGRELAFVLGNALTRVRVGGSIRIFVAYWQCYRTNADFAFQHWQDYHGCRWIWLHPPAAIDSTYGLDSRSLATLLRYRG
jgi:hypothetical protein